MKISSAERTNEKSSSNSVGLILAILFAVLYFVFGAGQAHAQEVQPAGAVDSLHVTLPGMPTAGAFGHSMTVLPNGNFVVVDPLHDVNNKTDVGSVTLYDGDTLQIISRTFGVVKESLIGNGGIVVLADGNFVIKSPFYAIEGALAVGAVTWCSAESGCPSHVTPQNSLTGSQQGDRVGWTVTPLGQNGYVVLSPTWHHAGVVNAGAVTRCLPVTDCVGVVVEAENSLVGSTIGDSVGINELVILENGDYVVRAQHWDFPGVVDAGAVVRCPALGDPCFSQITASNALVGLQAGDRIGSDGVVAAGDAYIVASSNVDFGANADAGAVTFCVGKCTGTPNAGNSLISGNAGDRLGQGGVKIVGNGAAYVIVSHNWNNAAVASAGAVTFCEVDDPCTGFIVKARSLYGSVMNDRVGGNGVTVLSNGDYVVASAGWSSGVQAVGAVTWCSGATGCLDQAVATTNSLHGSSILDGVGGWGVQALHNGGYIVSSLGWDNAGVADAGALTWCPSGGCTPAPVGLGNSLVGSQTLDQVGNVKVLANGNYVAYASFFNHGLNTDGGKVVLCNGNSGCSGPMANAPGMGGSVPGQRVGKEVLPLSNGHFLVQSNFDLGGVTNVGAMTWCSGTAGCPGQVTQMNSVHGARMGDDFGSSGMVATGTGDAMLYSAHADGELLSEVGAVTWMRGNEATGASIELAPGVYGGVAGAGASLSYAFNDVHNYLLVGLPSENKVVVVLPGNALFVAKAGNGSGTVTSSTGGIDCGDDCLESANSATTVTLTATPAQNSNFIGWSGGCSGTGGCQVTLQSATQVTATFNVKSLAVTIPDSFENGAVTVEVVAVPGMEIAKAADTDGFEEEVVEIELVEASEVAGVTNYSYGTVLKLTAAPDAEYIFDGWNGSLSGTQNPIQFTVTESMNIGASFRSVDAPDPELNVYLPVVTQASGE